VQLDFRAALAASSSSKATLISQRSGLWGRRQWILDFRFWIEELNNCSVWSVDRSWSAIIVGNDIATATTSIEINI
jgi:hypothetical protein